MSCSQADVTVSLLYRELVSRMEEMENERHDMGMMPRRLLPGTGWSGTVNEIPPSIKCTPGHSQIWRALELMPGICDPESLGTSSIIEKQLGIRSTKVVTGVSRCPYPSGRL